MPITVGLCHEIIPDISLEDFDEVLDFINTYEDECIIYSSERHILLRREYVNEAYELLSKDNTLEDDEKKFLPLVKKVLDINSYHNELEREIIFIYYSI